MEILEDLHYDSLSGRPDQSKSYKSEPPKKKLRKTTLHLYLPKIAEISWRRERSCVFAGATYSPNYSFDDDERTRSTENERHSNRHLQLQDFEKLPLVVFVHGGGWRRGHTENWKYFLSRFDTNLLMALYSKYCGHYGNIGESFALSGLTCAVVTYPLLKPPMRIMLIESVTSFLMSWFVFLVPFLVLYLIFGILQNFNSDEIFLSQFTVQHLALHLFVVVLLSLLMSQVFTKVLVILNISNYNSSDRKYPERLIAFLHICLLIYLAVCLAHAVITISQFKLLVMVDAVCTQCLIIGVQIWNRRIRDGNDFAESVSEQVKTVARAVRRLADMAAETHLFSAKDIVLCGHSAGGSVVSLLGLDESYLVTAGVQQSSIKGIISLCGIYDVSSLERSPFTKFFYLIPVFGKNIGDWKNLSPVHQIKKTNKWKSQFLIASSPWEPILRTDTDQFEAVLLSSGFTCVRIELKNKNHISILNSFSGQGACSYLERACLEFIRTL